MLINCALGFDSYLVMRHGDSSTPTAAAAAAAAECVTGQMMKLGCYFCNDVVAAVNSQKDRTLDQQVSTVSFILSIILLLGHSFYCLFVVYCLLFIFFQCTVTRPGLSFIAAGLAVEMMVNLLQSPLGIHHPAPPVPTTASGATAAGVDTQLCIPHQIRGFLSSYSQMTVTVSHSNIILPLIITSSIALFIDWLFCITQLTNFCVCVCI